MMDQDQMLSAMLALWAELPPSGTCVDLDKLEALFCKHFPDAKMETMTFAELDAIRAEAKGE